MATGDASGSWGTVTNTNLELIGEAFGYGTETIGNADTTITMADGASDAARSFYLKIISSADLTTTRVITLAPNTVSKVWIIENATSGSQIITIKQGTGATINIPNGHVKMVATDGAGSGGAVLDLLTDLNVATNLFVKNAGTGDGSTANIYLQTAEADIAADDVIGKINFQAPNEGTGTDAILVSAAIQAISEGDFSSSSNATSLNFMTGASEAATTKMTLSSGGNLTVTGDIDVDGTANLDVVDIDGAVDMASTLQVDGAITSSAGATITTADNTTQLTLKSTDADASAGPRFDLTRDSASPADGDNIGRIRYLFDNDAGEQTEGIRIDGVLQDVSDGTEDVAYVIDTIIGGTLRERVGYRAAETVFNEDSVDLDFRVESNGATYALFVDGGNNHVNIMTSTDLGAVLNVSGNAYIQHADNSDTLTLESTDGDANSGPNLRLYRNSSSPADNDFLGTIDFEGRNDNSQDFVAARIFTFTPDVTDGSEDAQLQLSMMKAGASHIALEITPDEFVINNGSVDLDFRVESNGNANMLFVDGGSDHVNIGTGTDHGGALNVETSDNSVNLVLACTSTNTSEGPILDLTRDAGNVPGDNDVMGVIRFRNDNTDLAMHNYAQIEARTVDVSAGTEDGRLEFATVVAGTEGTSRILLDGAETVVNDNSVDLDFRVESNGNANMLFVDGGNDQVSIGGAISETGDTLQVTNAGSGGATNTRFVNTNADASGVRLDFMKNTSSPADGDGVVQLNFLGKDSSGNAENYANINVYMEDVTSGTEDGSLVISTIVNGTNRNRLDFLPTETVFNEGGQDINFRVEGSGLANLLKVDAGAGSGKVGINCDPTDLFYITGQADSTAMGIKIGTNGFNAIEFDNATGSLVGRITTSAASTAYVTSSDYRLKENVADMTNATARLKQLKPKRFNWIADDTNTTLDGFLAHEVSSVVPEAVAGEKDAVHPDGHHEAGEIDPQGLDYSKLVPLLVKTIQELEARITTLEG
tara:strand:+ start:2254 stop:5232 length:2979 start_codon:yes stop_codon:yes gene_type:complete